MLDLRWIYVAVFVFDALMTLTLLGRGKVYTWRAVLWMILADLALAASLAVVWGH